MERKKKKAFDAVEWSRAIRDENHRKYGHLSTKEFLLALEKEANDARAKPKDTAAKPA